MSAASLSSPDPIRFRDLSKYNPPRRDFCMAILKAYFDDSGDPKDPKHSCVTIAGYVSTVEGWDWFEHHWPEVMTRHGVPYLHMKELWDREGTYKTLKATPHAETEFLIDCIKTIQIAAEFCVSSTIRLADLEVFNSETGLALEPLALALYGCLVGLREEYPDAGIEIFVDRMTKPHLTIDVAEQYARSDTYADLKVDNLLIAPLAKGDSFRNILPIQAADLMAYEVRKNCEERRTFDPPEQGRTDAHSLSLAYLQWKIEFQRKNGRPPRDRKSAQMLSAWPPPRGHLWDYKLIKAAHLNRHKGGWGV
jgi:hypothetical protein